MSVNQFLLVSDPIPKRQADTLRFGYDGNLRVNGYGYVKFWSEKVTEYVVVECFVELKRQRNQKIQKKAQIIAPHPPTHPPTSGSLNSPVFSIFLCTNVSLVTTHR